MHHGCDSKVTEVYRKPDQFLNYYNLFYLDRPSNSDPMYQVVELFSTMKSLFKDIYYGL